MTPWLRELQGHLASSIDGSSRIKYLHKCVGSVAHVLTCSFAHDGSIAALLGVLQIHKPVWPGLASEVVFELWKTGEKHFVRVLFSGQPLVTSTPLGVLDMIAIEQFNAYLDSVLVRDIVGTCNP